nr:glutamine--tRNA ligase [Planctomycetota bacterium]
SDQAEEGEDFTANLNTDSLKILDNCFIEPSLADCGPLDRVQFERLGYFCVDPERTEDGRPIFNRTVTLRDTWAKMQKAQQKK